MAFGSQMYNAIKLFLFEKIGDKIIVYDITFHKSIIGLVFYIYKVLKVPRIS